MNKYQWALDKLAFYSGLGLIDENTSQREERWEEFQEAKNNVQELVDREIPIKLIKKFNRFEITLYDSHCPKCDWRIIDRSYNYCPVCGQHLDWSDKK